MGAHRDTSLFSLLIHCLVLGPRRIFARVHPDIHDRGTAGFLYCFPCSLECGLYLVRVTNLFSISAQHFSELREWNVAQQVADISALLAVLGNLPIPDLVHRRVVADDCQIWRIEAVCRLHVESGHAERAVDVVAEHFLLWMGKFCGQGKARLDAERSQRTRIHPPTKSTRP